MSYTVLARKYRPQIFADLAGQEHVSRTLGNAIAEGRVAHAFLFTGARGVGKTTTARLLAKALNCEQGPTASPCNQCSPCREIAAGNDLDVLEIDGASNNSVDDVRRLQETLPFRPARDRFKVVIVDEVHMLSTGAFNAFLKTLEEPPPHVKFVFATTEVHKVPITIRSRCQRYDFRLIPRAVVAAHVRGILEQEQISADDEAISIVVREADGSLRDALTVLDQLLAFGGRDGLRGEEVARGLGIADRRLVLEVAQALLDGDAATCLRAIAKISDLGLDVIHFARQLLTWMRDLVVLRVVGNDRELVDRGDDEREQAGAIAAKHTAQHLERTFAGLAKLMEEVAQAGDPQLLLEMGLARLADRPPLEPLAELLSRLQALEQRIGGSMPGGRGPSGGKPGTEPGGPQGGFGAGRGAVSSGSVPPRGGLSKAPESTLSQVEKSAAPRMDEAPPASPARAAGDQEAERASRTDRPANATLDAERSPVSTTSRQEAPVEALRAPGSGSPPRVGPAPTPPTTATSLQTPSTAEAPALTPLPPGATPQTCNAAAASALAARAAGAAPQTLSAPAAQAPVSAIAPQASVNGAAPRPSASSAPSTAATPVRPSPATSATSDAVLRAARGSDLWSELLSVLSEAQPALGAVLEHAAPLEVSHGKLCLGFVEGSFHGRQAATGMSQQALGDTAERLFGQRPTIELRFGSFSQPSRAAQEEARRKQAREDMRRAALSHPRVQDALEVFPEANQGPVDVQPEDGR